MNQDQEIERLLSRLVAYKTTNGATQEITECFDMIENELSFFPFHKKTYVHNGIESRVWLTRDTKKPSILLNSHLDVVPGSKGMFTMKRDGENFVGRGVSDMKFAIVCFILALRKIVEDGGRLPSLGIMINSDEEVGGKNGVGHIVNDLGFRPEVVVIPDGGDGWFIVEEAKGVLQVKLESCGSSAHASTPWEGKNAAIPLIKDLGKILEKFPELEENIWMTTMNLGQIHCGLQTNQVPDQAVALLDIRHVNCDDKASLKKIFTDTCINCKVTFPIEGPAFIVDRNSKSVQLWKRLISGFRKDPFIKEEGASDGRYFSDMGATVILCKPRGGAIHTEKEWINAQDVGQFTDVIREFILQMSKNAKT